MNVKSRIALLVEADGARRAASDIDHAADATRRLGDRTETAGRRQRGARRESDLWRRSVRGLTTALTLGAAAAAGFGFVIGKKAVDEYRESWKAGRQTAAVIKSTGRAANVSAKQVGDLAGKISLKAGIDDEAIQSAENVLLTFKGVRNEVGKHNKVFNEAVKIGTDMAVQTEKGLRPTMVALGKALNDPAKGMSALSRVGVTFTDGQEKQVKTLVENGDAMKAQKIILGELNSEFKGSAEAQADPFDKAKVAIDNVAESLGYLIGPPLAKAAEGLGKFATAIANIADKDISLEKKLQLAGDAADRIFGPFIDKAKAVIDRMHLPRLLEGALDKAGPLMAQSAVRSAPKIAHAFIEAFKDAPAWAKLLTVGMLVGKLGPVFSIVGGIIQRRMLKKMVATIAADTTVAAASSAMGTAAGGGFISAMMARVAGGFALSSVTLAGAATAAGTALGIAAGTAAGVAFGDLLQQVMGTTLAGIVAAPIPGGTAGAVLGSGQTVEDYLRERGIDPATLEPSPGGGGLVGGVTDTATPGSGAVTERAFDSTSTPKGGGRAVEWHTHHHLDGKEIAHSVHRQALRDLLRSATV